jgi:hypothetical protein
MLTPMLVLCEDAEQLANYISGNVTGYTTAMERYEVLTALLLRIRVFWDVTTYTCKMLPTFGRTVAPPSSGLIKSSS